MSVTDGMAENLTCCTGTDVARSLARDPLADLFEVTAYENGECDVYGSLIHASLHISPEGLHVVHVHRMPLAHIPEAEMRLTRDQAIELRDALDVLITNTAQRKGE